MPYGFIFDSNRHEDHVLCCSLLILTLSYTFSSTTRILCQNSHCYLLNARGHLARYTLVSPKILLLKDRWFSFNCHHIILEIVVANTLQSPLYPYIHKQNFLVGSQALFKYNFTVDANYLSNFIIRKKSIQ